MGNLWNSIKGFVAAPVATNYSIQGVFLVVLLIMVAIVFWSRVLVTIENAPKFIQEV